MPPFLLHKSRLWASNRERRERERLCVKLRLESQSFVASSSRTKWKIKMFIIIIIYNIFSTTKRERRRRRRKRVYVLYSVHCMPHSTVRCTGLCLVYVLCWSDKTKFFHGSVVRHGRTRKIWSEQQQEQRKMKTFLMRSYNMKSCSSFHHFHRDSRQSPS